MLLLVAPAASDRVLGVDDVVDGLLSRRIQPLVARHRVGFAEGDRRQPVGIQPALLLIQASALLRDLHPRDQVVKPRVDHLLVLALLVRLAGPQKGEDRHRGGRVARLDQAARIAALAAAIRAERVIEGPAAIGHLVPGEPVESQGDSLLAGVVAAVAPDKPLALRPPTRESIARIGADRGNQVVGRSLLQSEIAQIDVHGGGRFVEVCHLDIGRLDHRFQNQRVRRYHVERLERLVLEILQLVERFLLAGSQQQVTDVVNRARRKIEHRHGQKQDHVKDHAQEPTRRGPDQIAEKRTFQQPGLERLGRLASRVRLQRLKARVLDFRQISVRRLLAHGVSFGGRTRPQSTDRGQTRGENASATTNLGNPAP